MSYSFFNDVEYAGPTPKDVLSFWDRQPRQLRPNPRIKIPNLTFPNSNINCIPERANKEDAMNISTFWNSFYSGQNWNFKCNFKDVERWMDQGFILLLKQKINSKLEIVATFLCRIIKGGVTCGKYIPQAAILDGFVVHPRLRKTGIASMMFAAIDKEVYNTPSLKESILVCFREIPTAIHSIHLAPIAVLKYSYIFLTDISKHNTYATAASEDLVNNIVNLVLLNSEKEFTISCKNYSDPDIYWFLVNSSLIGIAYTHRHTNEGLPIWEVIFGANLSPPFFSNLQIPIEICAKNLPSEKGVLFASNSKSRGNLITPSSPWVSGTSGYLSVHVYNWMPPTFITGDLFFPQICV